MFDPTISSHANRKAIRGEEGGYRCEALLLWMDCQVGWSMGMAQYLSQSEFKRIKGDGLTREYMAANGGDSGHGLH